jgi:hypothetical protein
MKKLLPEPKDFLRSNIVGDYPQKGFYLNATDVKKIVKSLCEKYISKKNLATLNFITKFENMKRKFEFGKISEDKFGNFWENENELFKEKFGDWVYHANEIYDKFYLIVNKK